MILNRRRKTHLFILGYFAFELNDIIESLEVTGDIRKRLKTSATNIMKAFADLTKQIEKPQVCNLYNTLKNNELCIRAKSETVTTKEPIDQIGNFIETHEKGGALFDICDYAIIHCINGCKLTKEKEIKQCTLKKAFETVGVPYLDEFSDCPYRIKRE